MPAINTRFIRDSLFLQSTHRQFAATRVVPVLCDPLGAVRTAGAIAGPAAADSDEFRRSGRNDVANPALGVRWNPNGVVSVSDTRVARIVGVSLSTLFAAALVAWAIAGV
jgi:hypothetical protein